MGDGIGAVAVREGVALLAFVAALVAEGTGEGDPEGVAECQVGVIDGAPLFAVGLGEEVCAAALVDVGVSVPVFIGVGDCVFGPVRVTVGAKLALTTAVTVQVLEGVQLGEAVTVGVDVPAGVEVLTRVALTVLEGTRVGDSVGVRVHIPVGVKLLMGVAVPVFEGAGVGEPVAVTV